MCLSEDNVCLGKYHVDLVLEESTGHVTSPTIRITDVVDIRGSAQHFFSVLIEKRFPAAILVASYVIKIKDQRHLKDLNEFYKCTVMKIFFSF